MEVVPPVVVDVDVLEIAGNVAADCYGEYQGSGDPEWTIQIWLQFHSIVFLLAWNEGGYQSFHDFIGVYVKVALIEGKAPYRLWVA